jgi:tetratricopeptide (TPR) repeat protein
MGVPAGDGVWPAWKLGGICAGLVVLIMLVYGQTAGFGFVNFDDGGNVYQAPEVTAGLSMRGVGWAFTHTQVDRWTPLATISRMMDCQVYGLWAGGHHLTNVLLHALATVFLFFALRKLTAATWSSALVAALFALHPLRVECVAWVSARSELLCGVFFMLSIWAYAGYARAPERRLLYATSLGWFALGLLSKPAIVMLPLALLSLDYWPLGRLRRWQETPALVKEKAPFLVLSVLCALATVMAQHPASQRMEAFPLPVRLGNAVVACVVYLAELLWPARLSVLYLLAPQGPPVWEIAGALLLLTMLTGGAWLARRRQPYWLAGWLWYLGMLAPVLGIIQTGRQAYADRYTYLPQIGLCLAVTMGAVEWAGRREERRAWLGAAAGVILCTLAALSWWQVTYWRDSGTLWEHALECDPRNHAAMVNLGQFYYEKGEADQAARYFAAAIAASPGNAEAYSDLGNALNMEGRPGDAMAQYRRALKVYPAYADGHYNLANVLLKTGSGSEAIAEYREALRIDPGKAEAYNGLANALQADGRLDEAIATYREAQKYNPDEASIPMNLGVAFCLQGHLDEGIAEYEAALRIKPDLEPARTNLGIALTQQGRMAEALAQLQEAVRLNPDISS